MKIGDHLSGMVCAMLVLGPVLPSMAADKETGLYFNVETGPNWAQDVHLTVAGISGHAGFDTGLRVGADVGYNFNKYLGVEFDTGFLWNTFSDFKGSLSHLPFMADGVFRYPNKSKFEPYLGAGIGGSVNILHIDDFGINDSDSDFNFAWQAMTGVRWNFLRNMYLGVGYKYFGTLSSGYKLNGVGVDVGASNNHMLDFMFHMVF